MLEACLRAVTSAPVALRTCLALTTQLFALRSVELDLGWLMAEGVLNVQVRGSLLGEGVVC